MGDLMTTRWLTASTPIPNAGLLLLLAAAGIAVASLWYQTWQCRRRHVDIDVVDGITNAVVWDETAPPPAGTPAEGGHDDERAAS